MATKKSTIKQGNDIIYPVTKAEAVYFNDGTNLEQRDINNYSIEEVNTGAKWIDGSPIYRKTVVYTGGLHANSSNVISHNISNLKMVIEQKQFGYSTNTNTTFTFPATAFSSQTPSGNSVSQWTVGPNYITFFSSMDYVDTIYITLSYTKTS